MLYTPGSIYDRFYRPGPKIPRGGVSLPSGGIRLPQAGARLPGTINNLLWHARPGHRAMLRAMLEGSFEDTVAAPLKSDYTAAGAAAAGTGTSQARTVVKSPVSSTTSSALPSMLWST